MEVVHGLLELQEPFDAHGFVEGEVGLVCHGIVDGGVDDCLVEQKYAVLHIAKVGGHFIFVYIQSDTEEGTTGADEVDKLLTGHNEIEN